MIGKTVRYVTDHWRGNHSLAWSFWVNLVALRCALFAVQEAATAAIPPGQLVPPWLAMPLVAVLHGGVFVWQAVGLLRAADNYSRSSGQMFKVWGAQLALIMAALWVMSYSFEAWHLTRSPPESAMQELAETEAKRTAKYRIAVSSEQTSVSIQGSFELGLTARLATLLDANPSVSVIRLQSRGGNVFEARGVSALIRARKLETLVDQECSSACTLVFISGTNRKLLRGAKLGFHKYRLDTDVFIPAVDLAKEQQRDLATFRKAGVAPWFLDRLYQSASTEMWYPTMSELIDAGIVTQVTQSIDQ